MEVKAAKWRPREKIHCAATTLQFLTVKTSTVESNDIAARKHSIK